MDRRIAWLALLLAMLCGCNASIYPHAAITTFEQSDPVVEQKIASDYTQSFSELRADDYAHVTLFTDTVPEGIALERGVIEVQPGYAHEVVARFDLWPDRGSFPKYRDRWRRTYCYPQVPLTWLSLAMWALLPPFYPCWSQHRPTKSTWSDDVKRLVHVSGGNAAILEWINPQDDRANGASGFILRLAPSQTPEKPEQAKRANTK